MPDYVHPDVLVSTEWVAEHLTDPTVRIVESDEDRALYTQGHIPGAVEIDWHVDLQDPLQRDYIDRAGFERLCAERGISNDTTVVFYGDKNNWWACYALWVFRLFGHDKVKVMNGGRDKWVAEGRPLTREKPAYAPVDYPVPPQRRDAEIRAFYEDAQEHSEARLPLIDVRSPGEFRGEITHMPEYPQEGVLRGGHVPGARSVPWKMAVNDDSTFKSREELEKIYLFQLRRISRDCETEDKINKLFNNRRHVKSFFEMVLIRNDKHTLSVITTFSHFLNERKKIVLFH
jgi:thiosulfate/3-mercaptopyruvate sulfurtransferase